MALNHRRLLQMHNHTRLLMFAHAQHEQSFLVVLRVFNVKPSGDWRKFNDPKNLHAIVPGGMFIWDVTTAVEIKVENHTRYNPLDYHQERIDRDGVSTWIVDIRPTNNHITLGDQKLLEEWVKNEKNK